MPDKRPRGGQKGNLNAVRNSLFSWKRARMLPAGKDHIGKLVLQEEAGSVQDLGGPENMTTMKRGIVSDNGFALGLILLALEEAQQRGSIAVEENGRWDLMPGLQKIKGLIDTRRQNFLALGLERRAKDVDKTVVIRRSYNDAPPAPASTGGEYPTYDTPPPNDGTS
jgi:hypothetical protein